MNNDKSTMLVVLQLVKKYNLKLLQPQQSVMLILRGFQNSNSLVVLGLVVLSLVFMIQIKQIYNNNQKYNRYMTYKQYMNEIATELKAVVKSVNKSSAYVRQLNEMLSKYRERSVKNISMSKVTSLS